LTNRSVNYIDLTRALSARTEPHEMGFFQDHRDTLTQALQAAHPHDGQSIGTCSNVAAFMSCCFQTDTA
jgi:hypothetical protein